MTSIKDTVMFKLKTPAYNALSTIRRTVKSSELNNTPPIYALTQIRNIEITEDKSNIFNDKKNDAKLLVSLTGNGLIIDDIPPQQSGTYTLMFDDFTSIAFTTGFNSNYGFGLYKYTGICNNFGEYKIADINWFSQASGNNDADNWGVVLGGDAWGNLMLMC